MGLARFFTIVFIASAIVSAPIVDAAPTKKTVAAKTKGKSATKKSQKSSAQTKHNSKVQNHHRKSGLKNKSLAKGTKTNHKAVREVARAPISAHDLALAPEAQFQQAMSYTRTGKRKKPDWAHAIPLLEKSATTYPLAQYRLADYYLGNWGKDHRTDSELGYHYLEKASNAGYLQAQVEFARYLEKKGERPSALKLWREAADQGHIDAMLRYVELNDVKKYPSADPVLAYAYIQIAAQQILSKRAGLPSKTEREKKTEEAFQLYMDEMASGLNDEQKTTANTFVASWQAKPTEITQHVDKLPKK